MTSRPERRHAESGRTGPWSALALLVLTASCVAHVPAKPGERLALAAGQARELAIETEAGALVELAIEPAGTPVEVEVTSDGRPVPAWHDGRSSEDGIACPPGRVTTLRFVAEGPAELTLLSWADAAVTVGRRTRPAPARQLAAWNARRGLVDTLAAGELEDPAALEAGIGDVAALFGEAAATATAVDLAGRLLDAGLFEDAAGLLETALEGRREAAAGVPAAGVPADEATADLLSCLATARFYLGRWDEAFDLHAETLEIRRRVLGADHPLVARTLVELAVVRWQQARFRDASRLLDEALTILDPETADPREVAAALQTSAQVLRDQGRFADSEAAFRRAAAIWEATGRGGYLYVHGLLGLGKVLRDRGQYVEWDRVLTRVGELLDAEPRTQPYERLGLDLQRAELLRLSGRTEDAEPVYRRQLEAARDLFGAGNPELLYHLNQTAVFFAESGRFPEAAALYREALDLVEATVGAAHPLRAQVLEDLGALELRRGRAEAAVDAFRRSLADREQAFGERHVEVAISLTGLAEALAEVRGREAEALDAARRALVIFRRSRLFPEVSARALALEATLLDRGGRRGEAIEVLEEALVVVEGLRSTAGSSDRALAGFFGRYQDLYHRMVGWQVAAGDADAAFATLERSRGRAFLDQLAAGEVDLLAGLPDDRRRRLEEERDATGAELAEAQTAAALAREDGAGRAELERRQQQVAELAGRLHEIESRIRAESPLWRDLVTREGRPADAGEVQADLLGLRRLLIAYQIGPERSFVFVVPATGEIEVVPLELDADAADLLALAPGPLTRAAASDAVARALPGAAAAVRGLEAPAEFTAGADEVRHALWRVLVPRALAERLAAVDEAIVVPDGALHRLPLEILVPELSADDTAGSYWLDTGPVLRYGLSSTVLVNLERRPASGGAPGDGRAVIVADPRPAEGRGLIAGALRRLPGTAREAEAIAGVLSGAGDPVVLAGPEASEARLRHALASPTRILHVATHGIVEEGAHELLAALALTPPADVTSPDDDGLLQLHEIYRLDLPAELAVLSACETSLGREVEGEGAFALSRGFLVAGARRVVASLWSVDDASTAELMAAFYRDLGQARDPARALRDAKRRLRARTETADPFYWAAFVLSGAG